MTSFEARTTRLPDGCCTLTVSGEVDVGVADQLTDLAVASLQDETVSSLVIDLGGVTFLDSTGISALIRARNASAESGTPMVLHAVPDRVARLLHLTGLDGIFTVE